MKELSETPKLINLHSGSILFLLLIAALMPCFQFCNPISKSDKTASIETEDSIQLRRFFSEKSFWNQPLTENEEIDPQNAHFLELLKKEPNGPFFKINLLAWTIPVYEVDDSTPRYKIQLHYLSPAEKQRWNTSRETFGHGKEFDAEPVPIPEDARADPQEDAHCALVDWKNRIAWDMWGLKKNADGSWTSNTGMKYSIDSEGVFDPREFGMVDGESVHYFGPSRASGVPAIAGLIMYDEVKNGEINHKLACATRANAYKEHVFPAIWTDGFIVGGIPEGAVIQLDPKLDLSEFNLWPGEMAVAKALQKYGMVVTDIAAANTLYGEGLWGHPGKSWNEVLREDGGGISAIPIENYRILKIKNRVNKGDSYTKILNDAGQWP